MEAPTTSTAASQHGPAALLERLISFPTMSARPSAPLADFICDFAERAGIRVHRQDYDSGAKANLVLRVGPQTPGEGLLLCGHIDVVPADEPDWRTDPFTLTQVERSPFAVGAAEASPGWCGRGVADMKGFVALALHALAEHATKRLNKPLALLLTSDEEIGAIGTQQFLCSGGAADLPRQVLLGEPTRLAAVRMHKGHLKMRGAVRGQSSHSGLPHQGVNAIELAGAVIRRLSSLAAEWRAARLPHAEHFPECPFPVLNLGMIRGGAAVNIVPAECALDVGIRLLPGQETAQCLDQFHFAMNELPRDVRERVEWTVVNDNPPLLCREDAPIHRLVTKRLGQTRSLGVSFASDAGPLARAGFDCVLWGPGEMDHAHRANEYLSHEQFAQAQVLLRQIIEDFCVARDGEERP
jgi:acetylornithine deacetylase